MYHDHYFECCIKCIHCLSYVCCYEYYDVSNEHDEQTHGLMHPIAVHGGKVQYVEIFCFRCDICMCVANYQFKLLVFVFNFVYVEHLTFCCWVCVFVWCVFVSLESLSGWQV